MSTQAATIIPKNRVMDRKSYRGYLDAHPGALQVGNPFTLFRVDVINAEAVFGLDPLLASGDVLQLVANFTEPLTVEIDGEPAFTLTPTDAGQPAKTPSLDVLEAIIASAGVDDDGEESTEWEDLAIAAMRAVLSKSTKGPMAEFRGETAAIRIMAASAARSYGAAPDLISKNGAAYTPRRLLLPPMHHATRLAERARRAAEDADRAEAEFAAAQVEARRPRSLADLGLDGVVVRKGRLAATSEAPFYGAVPIYESATEAFYAWRRFPGLTLPTFDDGGVRSMVRDEPLPPFNRVFASEPSNWAAGFIQDVRARYGKHDTGPVPRDRFTNAGIGRAREFLATRGDWLLIDVASMARGFRQRLAMECLVRGFCLRPDIAALLAIGVRDGAHGAAFPSARFPTALAPLARATPPETEWTEIGKVLVRDERQPAMIAKGVLVRDEPRPMIQAWREEKNPAARPPGNVATDPLSALAIEVMKVGIVGIGELLETETH